MSAKTIKIPVLDQQHLLDCGLGVVSSAEWLENAFYAEERGFTEAAQAFRNASIKAQEREQEDKP